MSNKITCPKCGKENEPENSFCVYCGSELTSYNSLEAIKETDNLNRTDDGRIICPKCGNYNDPDLTYCTVCGTNLKEKFDSNKTNVVEGVRCPHCGQINEKSNVFCTNCGNKIVPGAEVKVDSAIKCPVCGSTQIEFRVEQQGSGYNLPLGIVCGIICFPLGFLMGLIGANKGKKNVRHCRKCGHDF